MREDARRAMEWALKRETDKAVRQWARLMLKGEAPVTRPRRKRKAPAARSPKVRTRK
jgi:hypothetical protein